MGIYNPAEVLVWNYGSLPFVSDDVWVTVRTWQELQRTMPELNNEITSQNVHILTNYITSPSDLLTTFPVNTVDDLQGKKIRATGSYMNLLTNVGAIPVNLGYGEAYQALDRGTVDGVAG